MSALVVGARVFVHASWSSFKGMRGVVTETNPLMVKLDGDLFAMRFGEREVIAETETPLTLTGAE